MKESKAKNVCFRIKSYLFSFNVFLKFYNLFSLISSSRERGKMKEKQGSYHLFEQKEKKNEEKKLLACLLDENEKQKKH